MADGRRTGVAWSMGHDLPAQSEALHARHVGNRLGTESEVETRPPMPWFTLRDMTEQDLRAIYKYVNALGPAGEAAPIYVPPGHEPKRPYVQFPAPPTQ